MVSGILSNPDRPSWGPRNHLDARRKSHWQGLELKGRRLAFPRPQGKVATQKFNLVHSKDKIDKWLEPPQKLGDLDSGVVVEDASLQEPKERRASHDKRPSLSQCLIIKDFEAAAQKTMRRESREYYSTGPEDEFISCVRASNQVEGPVANSCYQTITENIVAFQRICFRPKVLVNVEHVDYINDSSGSKDYHSHLCHRYS